MTASSVLGEHNKKCLLETAHLALLFGQTFCELKLGTDELNYSFQTDGNTLVLSEDGKREFSGGSLIQLTRQAALKYDHFCEVFASAISQTEWLGKEPYPPQSETKHQSEIFANLIGGHRNKCVAQSMLIARLLNDCLKKMKAKQSVWLLFNGLGVGLCLPNKTLRQPREIEEFLKHLEKNALVLLNDLEDLIVEVGNKVPYPNP